MPREYKALQFCLAPGKSGTQGHYLLIGLTTLYGMHMRLWDVLRYTPDFMREATYVASHYVA